MKSLFWPNTTSNFNLFTFFILFLNKERGRLHVREPLFKVVVAVVQVEYKLPKVPPDTDKGVLEAELLRPAHEKHAHPLKHVGLDYRDTRAGTSPVYRVMHAIVEGLLLTLK